MTKVTNIQINKLTNINILNNFKEFHFSFDLSKPRSSWKLNKSVGGSIKKIDDQNVTTIYYCLSDNEYKIAELYNDNILIYTPTSRIVPLYFIQEKNIGHISNVIENLIMPHSEIKISSFGLGVNLSRIWAPYNHLFSEINSLIPLCIYNIKENKLSLQKLNLSKMDVTLDETVKIIYEQYEKLFKKYKEIFLFITGGYDSRTNLALATHFAKKYNNNINLARIITTDNSNYKSTLIEKEEDDLTLTIAKDNNFNLLRFSVDSDILNLFRKNLYSDERFIRMNCNITRPSTTEYFLIFSYIKENFKNSLIIANQTDCHKGKGYNLIKDIKSDYHLLGVAGEGQQIRLSKFFKYAYKKGFQKKYIKDVLKRSSIFDKYGQIDYFYYDTYNSMIFPARSIWHNIFDIPFPFLNAEFVEHIFNLDYHHKIDAKICKHIINELKPELLKYKVLSGSSSSYRKKSIFEFLKKSFNKIRLITEKLSSDSRAFRQYKNTQSMINEEDWNKLMISSKDRVLQNLINYSKNYKNYHTTITVICVQLIILKLNYIEKNLKASFKYESEK